jgi:hypothetical protein
MGGGAEEVGRWSAVTPLLREEDVEEEDVVDETEEERRAAEAVAGLAVSCDGC